MVIRQYIKDGKIFKISFDEDGIMDTCSIKNKTGDFELLPCGNRYVDFFLNNSKKVYSGISFKNAERI